MQQHRDEKAGPGHKQTDKSKMNKTRQLIQNKWAIVVWEKKANSFWSVTGPLNWILSAVGGLRFINVHARLGMNWSHVDTVGVVSRFVSWPHLGTPSDPPL